MSVTICATMKRENNYIDEWLSWHIGIGVDKFILYDNNDGMEDYPMTEYASKLVISKVATIANMRNRKLDMLEARIRMLNACTTEWAVFLDIDEFIKLRSPFTSISEWLSQDKFNGATNVRTSVKCFTNIGSNEFYGDYNVLSRFTVEQHRKTRYNYLTKAFIRVPGAMPKMVLDTGIVDQKALTVYCDGSKMDVNICKPIVEDFSEIEVDAYPVKSMQEYFMMKVLRNRARTDEDLDMYKEKYFEVNGWSPEDSQTIDFLMRREYKDGRNAAANSYAEFDFGDGKPDGSR